MPPWLGKQNGNAVPANAMWLTSAMVQVFLILTLVSKASYLALISLSTAMILLPYLLSALYAVTMGRGKPNGASASHATDKPIAVLAVGYCLWLLYAAGPKYLLLSALLYAPGAALYLLAKKQLAQPAFAGREWAMLAGVLLLAVIAAYLLASGGLAL